MKKLILFIGMLIAFSLNAFSQTVTVRGTVTEEKDGEPLVGATITAKGTQIATMTDIDGKFTLEVPVHITKLVVSYVGMFPVEVDVKPNVNVVMEENTQVLNEVIVTGYGVQQRAAFTGAASVVSGETVDRKSDTNFVKSLEGSVTGLQYDNVSNSPGMFGSVSIRGIGTINSSSQPLYVIDGVPVNAEVISNSSSSSGNFFDPMAAYNPNDIESITVLKDAAATAIYGSRAANGVIVITTKKGGTGAFHLTFETRQGYNAIANNNMKFATAEQTLPFFARGLQAQYPNDYDTYEEYYDEVKETMMSRGWDGYSTYNWMDLISRKGYYSDYNLSLNGTSGKTNYYVNLNLNKSDGPIIASSNTRYGGRVNLDSSWKIISFGANTSYSYSIFNGFSQSTGGTYSNPIYSAMTQMNVFMPPYINGEYSDYITYYQPLAIWDKELGNINRTNTQTINLNPWMKIDLPYDFWIKTNFGANITNVEQYEYESAIYYRGSGGRGSNGTGVLFNSKLSQLTWTNTIGWSHTYGDNFISVLLGQEMQKRYFTESYFEKTDFPYAGAGMRDISTAANPGDSDAYTEETRLASYFMDAHYDYANRYYLSASFRRDGSSVFGKDNRWANFWSVGGKWRISEESWLRGNNVLTNAALRVSYGTVGNQSIGAYSARGVYQLGASYDNNAGMQPSGLNNPTLTWETSKKFDAGLDLSFINRWHLTFDFFNEITDDLLYQRPLSYVTGMSAAWSNIGKIRNRGVELGINGTAFHANDVLINVFGNLSYNQNVVLELSDNAESLLDDYTIVEVGRPYYQYYMKEYAGVDRETGNPLYYLNETGDEVTTSYNDAARRYLGSSLPKVYGAFGLNANAYGFDLSIQFNYRLGGKLYNSLPRGFGWGYQYRSTLEKVVLDSWTPENPDAKYPIYKYSGSTVSSNYSSRWLMNGNYLRLSNITVGYTVPQKLTRKAFIDKLRLYVTLDNVHTWTSSEFTGWTPDSRRSGNISSQYPGVFTFTGGVQVTF